MYRHKTGSVLEPFNGWMIHSSRITGWTSERKKNVLWKLVLDYKWEPSEDQQKMNSNVHHLEKKNYYKCKILKNKNLNIQ